MNSIKAAKSRSNRFIPADESPLYLFFFDLLARFLFRLRFKSVFIKNSYKPAKDRKTIYYLNHTTWWDGLIPLLLNRRIFKQNARAMMEDKQMRTYPFFRKLGTFSVNLTQKKAIHSTLSYALASLEREQGALYLFPEGEIRPFSSSSLTFKQGLAWLLKRCPVENVDAVPVSIYMHTAFSNKPELFIHIGQPVIFSPELSIRALNTLLEERLCADLRKLVEISFHHRDEFELRL